MDLGESLQTALMREVEEETGLFVEVGDVVWVGDTIDDHRDRHFVLIDFRCSVTGGQLAAGDDAEEVRWVDLTTAYELPMPPTMYQLLDVLNA